MTCHERFPIFALHDSQNLCMNRKSSIVSLFRLNYIIHLSARTDVWIRNQSADSGQKKQQ